MTESDRAAIAEITEVMSLVEKAYDMLHGYEDVEDGSYGEQMANWAMHARRDLNDVLDTLGSLLDRWSKE